jgi:hypothetical protein
LLSPSPPPLQPHQPSPLLPSPLSPSPRHRPSNLFSTPPLCHPLHAHVVAPCRRGAIVLMQHINTGFCHGVNTMCPSVT